MAGLDYQQPMLDGWGNSGPFYDHRFLGFDKAPYRSIYLPAQPMGPYLRSLEPFPEEGFDDLPDDVPDDGLSSEDEDDYEDGLDMYAHVDLNKMLGQQLAVWCHRSPDTLAIFTPIPGDTLATVMSFARSTLQCDPSVDRLLLLATGKTQLVDPADIYAAKPGSAVLVVPKYDYVVSLEVTQLNVKLQTVVSVTMTVRSLKAALLRDRGFPIDRTDLLFRDQPMENQRHLFDYHITHGSTIFVMLHLVYDVRVVVETFWGLRYEIYVDPCMTTGGLLNIVLRRTVSAQAGDVSRYFHLILPRHALVMYSSEGQVMKWSSCLGLYGLDDNSTFSLATIALAHQMSVQTIPVIMDNGKLHNFLVSKYDYWSVLALKIHGISGHPINLMRLFHGKHELDTARAVGTYSHKTSALRVDLSLMKFDHDVHNGIAFNFRLGNGVDEVLKCSPLRTVKTVKSILEEIGVPNASSYDFFVDGYRLPNAGRIGDVIEEYKRPIDLKLRNYAVFVHAPKGIIYKMNAYAQEAFKVFKARVQMKTGLSQSDYYMLMSGMPITDHESNQVFQTPLAIGSSVFLMSLQKHETIFVVWDDWLVKLRLPFHPQPSEIKDILWKDRNIPEGSLASVANFLQWYFTMRATSKGLLTDFVKEAEQELLCDSKPRQSRPRKRRSKEEADLWQHNFQQMEQLQRALEKRNQQQDRRQQKQASSRIPDHLDDLQNSHYKHLNLQNTSALARHADPHHKKAVVKRRHHKQNPFPEQPAPEEKIPRNPRRPESIESDDPPGIYYSTKRHGKWRRVNPEDLVDNYLRAWSMPPDPVHKVYDSQYIRRRKHHTSVPDMRRKVYDATDSKEPEWVYSLKEMARLDKVQPAYAGLLKKKRRKKKSRMHTK